MCQLGADEQLPVSIMLVRATSLIKCHGFECSSRLKFFRLPFHKCFSSVHKCNALSFAVHMIVWFFIYSPLYMYMYYRLTVSCSPLFIAFCGLCFVCGPRTSGHPWNANSSSSISKRCKFNRKILHHWRQFNQTSHFYLQNVRACLGVLFNQQV